MEARQQVTIVGGGSMGTLFAHALAAEHDVTIVDTRADVVEAIRKHGALVDDLPARAVRATRDASHALNAAFLFVFVKANQTLAALRPFAEKLNPASPIISLQNGLGNEEAIKAALGGNVPLVIGITDVTSATLAPGRSQRLTQGVTVLGSAGASHTTISAVAMLLERSGMPTRVVYDIRPHVWTKLIANTAINPVAAMLDAPNSVILASEHASQLARALANEGAAVAKALRINLPLSDPWEFVRQVLERGRDGRNSMTSDIDAKRATEIDATNGAVVAAGRRVGVATPYNDALVHLIKAREARALG